MSYVSLTCNECGKEFDKPKNEYNRRLRKGVDKFYCGPSCGVKASNKTKPRKGNIENFGGKLGKQSDEYTNFRWFQRRIEYRTRDTNYVSDIDLEYLSELWKNQQGLCPFSGKSLILPKNSDVWESKDDRQWRASLDRIDNDKGYIKGNVRFVSMMANIARNTFTDKEVIEFAKAVVKYQEELSIEHV